MRTLLGRAPIVVALCAIALCLSALLYFDGTADETTKEKAKETCAESKKAAKDTTEAVKHAYVGVGKCKMCHMPYFKAWEATGHAKAFDLLNAEKKENTNSECLPCHTTGFGAGGYETGKDKPDLKGVQCEACHGAGADYMKMSVMKDHDQSVKAGLVSPVGEAVCVGCHNKKSPTFKGFDLKEYMAKGVHKVEKKTEK
jgi:hypothetical protein